MSEIIGEIIERKRGDRGPDKITVPFDNTGFSYTLTVNTEKDPNPTKSFGAELVQVAGILTPGPSSSEVSFPWSALQANQNPGNYWYDIEQVDGASLPQTIAKNQYVIHQDITKIN